LKTKWNKPRTILLNRIEVSVDTAYEQYPTSRTTLSTGAQQGGKPHELSFGTSSDLESGIKTGIEK
jgi:hypothetical protein